MVLLTWPACLLPRQHLSEDAKDLIRKLLVKEPTQRLPLEQLPNHPWIIRNVEPARLQEAIANFVPPVPRLSSSAVLKPSSAMNISA